MTTAGAPPKPREARQPVAIRRVLDRVPSTLVVLLLTVAFALPFYVMVVASFMERSALLSVRPNLWPAPFILDNYQRVLVGDWVLNVTIVRSILNSFILATGQTLPVLFFCSLAGFTFAKRRFPGRTWLFVLVLATMMVPYQSTLVGFFLLMSNLGWLNTFLPLWVPWWVPAFGVFFMRQYIAASIPDELLDAATIDGCSPFGLYWRIVLPLVTPALVVLGILNFVNAWNDFIYSNLIFTRHSLFPTTLYLFSFQGSQIAVPEYGMMAAASVLVIIPILILFLVFQRQLIGGIMGGAVRG